MGSCSTSKALSDNNNSNHVNPSRFRSLKTIEQTDRDKQILCLKLIYNDLANRSKSNNLNVRNFQMFFHLNWVLGSSLFKKFSTLNRNWLSEKQFISGIFSACDLNQENRIKFMFSVLDVNLNKGLSYCQLVGLLLSSPHQCLKQILKNEKFLDAMGFSELYNNIISSKKQGQISSNNFSLFPSLKYKKFHDDDCDKKQIASTNFKAELNEIQLVKQSKETLKKVLKQKIDQELYSSKLITKYAQYIFQNFKLDREKGELKLNQFRKIVSDNPIIFKSYYSGFHQYLWRHEGGFPLYKSLEPYISDYCMQKIGNEVRNVYMVLIKTSIMIFQCKKMKDPLNIKNLEGLEIKLIEGSFGFGFALCHYNSNYSVTEYYFEDKQKQNEWIEFLNQFQSISIQRKYKIKQKIATGTYSQVHQCTNKETNERCAVKIIKKRKENQPCFGYLQCQSQILALCTHQSLLRIKQRYETSKNIYLVMELLEDRNILDYIQGQNRRNLLQEEAKSIMKQLLEAMSRIHSLGVIHRDIKFENVLMKGENGKATPKIIDFGTAIFKMHIPLMQDQMKFVGAQPFKAPEIVNKQEYDQKIDAYSLGVMMFYMLIGRYPFEKESKTLNKLEYSELESRRLSSKAKELIKLLLCEKNERLSCEQALNHKWFH